MESRFDQSTGVQSSVAQNSTKLHQRYFREVVLKQLRGKLWKIFGNTYVVKFPFNIISQQQSAEYNRTKNSTTDAFMEVLRKQWIFQNFLNSRSKLCKTIPFSLTLQAYSLQLSTLQKQTLSKIFSVSALKYLEICLEQVHIELILLK